MDTFSTKLLDWFDREGRHDLPWQRQVSPYRVWISEIMLQQTQVGTVIPYYNRFMSAFPTIRDLAKAEMDAVLHHWTGLGYYARARNLHKTAVTLVAEHDGEFPQTLEQLTALPGIGRSTAGAILAIAMNKRAAILDGNVKRVLARFHEIEGWVGSAAVLRAFWEKAEEHTPDSRVADYTQAIMDLGATVCTRGKPECHRCPLQADCRALANHTTSQYPASKPRKKLPVKTTVMVLVELPSGEIYLEKRPATGLWGGLYSLPQLDSTDQLTAFLDQFGQRASQDTGTVMNPFRHTFSHFHLDIQPIRVKLVASTPGVAANNDAIWYNPNQPTAVGLAAPVKKLLDGTRGNT